MAQPTPYDRQANFSNEEALNPTTKTPGASLDAELNAAKISLDQTQANLALIQRDDGRLANASVGIDQIAPSLSIGFTLRGSWEAPENYVLGDGVVYDSGFWRAAASHVSELGSPPTPSNPLWEFLYSIVDIVPVSIPDGSVTDTKLRNSVGVSVIGRAVNSTGVPADIVAGSDGLVLVRVGGVLTFAQLPTASLTDLAVTTGKLADASVTTAKLGDAAVTTAKLDLTTGIVLTRDPRAAMEAVPTRALKGFIAGLEISTDGANTITVQPGVCVADGMVMRLTAAMSKLINATWAAGTGAGCLDTGAEAADAAYYVSIIGNPTTGAVDFIASGVAAGPTLPSGFTKRFDLPPVFNDSSANLRLITNVGDEVMFTAAPVPGTANLSMAAGARTMFALALPALRCTAICNFHFYSGAAAGTIWVTSPDNTDAAPDATMGRATAYLPAAASGQFSSIRVSTATGQVGVRFGAGMSEGQCYPSVVGFIYPRGRHT